MFCVFSGSPACKVLRMRSVSEYSCDECPDDHYWDGSRCHSGIDGVVLTWVPHQVVVEDLNLLMTSTVHVVLIKHFFRMFQ